MARATNPAPRPRRRRVRALRSDRRGASTVEYALILAFIVLMMFGALMQMAAETSAMWKDISTRVSGAR